MCVWSKISLWIHECAHPIQWCIQGFICKCLSPQKYFSMHRKIALILHTYNRNTHICAYMCTLRILSRRPFTVRIGYIFNNKCEAQLEVSNVEALQKVLVIFKLCPHFGSVRHWATFMRKNRAPPPALNLDFPLIDTIDVPTSQCLMSPVQVPFPLGQSNLKRMSWSTFSPSHLFISPLSVSSSDNRVDPRTPLSLSILSAPCLSSGVWFAGLYCLGFVVRRDSRSTVWLEEADEWRSLSRTKRPPLYFADVLIRLSWLPSEFVQFTVRADRCTWALDTKRGFYAFLL